MATRARILDAALLLFNEQGTAAVSTNHIAQAAGLSPGNLYYHFQDKKQIIRELHTRYAAGYERRYSAGSDGVVNLARLRQDLAGGLRWAWEYRFFEREILALLRADPQLCADYRVVYHRRLDEWSMLGARLVAQGLLRAPLAPLTLHDLMLAIWLIAESWLTFLDATGDPNDPVQVAKAADLVLVVIEPHLTEAGRCARSAAGRDLATA